jgi:hypothetical protein
LDWQEQIAVTCASVVPLPKLYAAVNIHGSPEEAGRTDLFVSPVDFLNGVWPTTVSAIERRHRSAGDV